jgi:hypothetical protein
MFAPEARGVYRDRNLTGQKRLMTHAPAIDHDFSRAGLYRKIPSTIDLIATVAKMAVLCASICDGSVHGCV